MLYELLRVSLYLLTEVQVFCELLLISLYLWTDGQKWHEGTAVLWVVVMDI
jgi:hypothetical protein